MQVLEQLVELHFQIVGDVVPVDHGYALFSSLSERLETDADKWVHEASNVALLPIRGRYDGKGKLHLGKGSSFGLRVPAELIPRFLPLVGERLRLHECTITVGVPLTRALEPAPVLYAHTVTTRNGQDEQRFDAEIARQLAALGVEGQIERGHRRIITIHGKKVVGHSLLVHGLSPAHSLLLQEKGLGGRRKMGCGVFVPSELRD